MAYNKPQQWKKEESGRLKVEGDTIKLVDLRFERWQVVRERKKKAHRSALTEAIGSEPATHGP